MERMTDRGINRYGKSICHQHEFYMTFLKHTKTYLSHKILNLASISCFMYSKNKNKYLLEEK